MATIILTAVGSAVGGPIGGALGSIIGQQIDKSVIGSGTRDGPRLQELAVTTSSYGQPISRVFGRMRVPGSIIWSTDLIERSEKTGGGKGRPSTKTYSYSASFAVALCSTPISALGRVWADGELLVGAAGDLKVGGELRLYDGNGDNSIDPTIAAALGQNAPAFRGCAYVVFEELDLSEFGNRIPALTFEVFGESSSSVTLKDIAPWAKNSQALTPLEPLLGYADQGGSVAGTLSALKNVFPLACVTTNAGLEIKRNDGGEATLSNLTGRIRSRENSGTFRSRGSATNQEPKSLRYYDLARDYQPSVQRSSSNRSFSQEAMVDLPATLNAAGAKTLANDNGLRSGWRSERLKWLAGEIDPQIAPGKIVLVEDYPGHWLIVEWEWAEEGLELSLERLSPAQISETGSDPGQNSPPADDIAGPTVLRIFELPPEESSDPSAPLIFAAASSSNNAWRGAQLFADQANGLVPIAQTGRERAILGSLVEELSPSQSTRFEAEATIAIELVGEQFSLPDTTVAGLAMGENRILVGGEVIQYLHAEQLSDQQWRLSGLLRGRGGTEHVALKSHAIGTAATFIDDNLTLLDSSIVVSGPETTIAAIGLGDQETVFASLQNVGLSRQPFAPVHVRASALADGSLEICWTRRARGQLLWRDGVDVPLVEETEAYVLGFGPVDAPLRTWSISKPDFTLSQAEQSDLLASFGSHDLWVMQTGTYGNSAATFVSQL